VHSESLSDLGPGHGDLPGHQGGPQSLAGKQLSLEFRLQIRA
jgi:hypothetical protein